MGRIGSMTAQEALEAQYALSGELLATLEYAQRWGIAVSRAQVTSITSPTSGPDRYEWIYIDLL